jgi:polysaccharide biosynthesis protein PslG
MRETTPDRRQAVSPRRLWSFTVTVTLLLSTVLLTQTANAAPSKHVTWGHTQQETHLGLSYGNTLVRMSPDRLAQTLNDAVALHARWIRADLSWTEVQADGPDTYHWGPFDRVVQAARARGLHLLPILSYTPAWARDPLCTRFTCPPRSAREFARFARTAAARYASLGVHTWEVWNEPNLPVFWPSPNAKRYAALLKATSRAIKVKDSSARVLLGGLAAAAPSWAPGSIDARLFLGRVCAAGACSHINGVAYHPYTYPYLASDRTSWGTAWERIDRTPWSLRSVLDVHGFPHMKIWATEYGAPTGGPGTASDGTPGSMNVFTDHVSEDRQAAIAADAVATAVRSRNVAALFWYTNQDNPQANGKEAYFGLRRSDGTRKPAWFSFQHALAAASH